MSCNELLEKTQPFVYARYSSLLLISSDFKKVRILSGVPFLKLIQFIVRSLPFIYA
ncbi:hypothetical protein DFP80_107161 [Marinomonas rhizomae]|uniref:Uncharacterized protein n=1 Tax=Marinomonas rhizomae TaxID=491948 RepID=A0A366J8A0_9GAMM|nr:hypothetical protein DFP80_107161 [Marinomonas rhizomae]